VSANCETVSRVFDVLEDALSDVCIRNDCVDVVVPRGVVAEGEPNMFVASDMYIRRRYDSSDS
jgi:hypothetical protein